MNASTRTLLLGLFAIAGRPLTASQLIALASPLKVTASNVKSHLTRMITAGVLLRTGSARSATYRPSKSQSALIEGIKMRLLDDRTVPWNGRWVVLIMNLPAGRARADAETALWLDGFRQLTNGVYVRPDWPGQWARQRALEHAGRSGFVFVSEPHGSKQLRPPAFYDLEEFDAEAHKLAAEIDSRRFERDPAMAFAARVATRGAVAYFIAHDPMVPKELWAGRKGIERVIAAYRRFDAATKAPADQFLHAAFNADKSPER